MWVVMSFGVGVCVCLCVCVFVCVVGSDSRFLARVSVLFVVLQAGAFFLSGERTWGFSVFSVRGLATCVCRM